MVTVGAFIPAVLPTVLLCCVFRCGTRYGLQLALRACLYGALGALQKPPEQARAAGKPAFEQEETLEQGQARIRGPVC